MSSMDWRLLLDEGGPGARQMATDRAILEACALGESPPTLRLYRFMPPCVTLGRFQEVSDVDLVQCADRGFDVARRPTGGRGVLHDEELTYSVIAGVKDGVPRGVAASYRYLCAGLVAAYRILGVSADLMGRDRGEGSSGACYLHATRADLSLGAAKLSGSAQTWQRDVCLQHGSFVLVRDIDAEAAVFGLDAKARDVLDKETTTLAKALGKRLSIDEVCDAAIEGMQETLGVQFEVSELSSWEIGRASELQDEYHVPYAHDSVGP